MSQRRRTFLFAFRTSLPVLTGYVAAGTAFGLLLQQAGYGIAWAALSSVLVYAGSMQFMLVGLLSDGSGPVAVAMVTLFVNFRHFFYGLSFLDVFKAMGRKRPYMVFALTDETYSVLCATTPPEDVDANGYRFWLALLDQGYWVAGSLLGAAVGTLIPFRLDGLDFAMTALFVVLLVEQWRAFRTHEPVFVGFAATVAAVLVFGRSNVLLPSLAVIVLGLLLLRRRLGREAAAIDGPAPPGDADGGEDAP